MTEADWLASTDPEPMLCLLGSWARTWPPPEQPRGKASERKLRLFACACVRQAWPLLHDARSREAVEAAERCVDGLLAEERRVAAAARAFDATLPWVTRRERFARELGLTAPEPPGPEEQAAMVAFALVAWSSYPALNAAVAGLQLLRARAPGEGLRLARCLFGNPFQAVRPDPRWLGWSGGLVRALAESIYEENRFRDLPILADALEEAGCADGPFLAHGREQGPHAHGCWLVDALLGKGGGLFS